MMRKLTVAIAAMSLALLAFTGCSGAGSPGTDDASSAGTDALAVGESSFGPMIVDGAGMTVYIFDEDTVDTNQSSCEAQCLQQWPPVLSLSGAPTEKGITGKIATITRSDGTLQVTANGMPLYYYANDTGPGDTAGQGADGVWWMVSPTGNKFGGE